MRSLLLAAVSCVTCFAAGAEPVAASGPLSAFGRTIDLDAWLRFVDEIPAYGIAAHVNLDVRFAWRPAAGWELSVVGQNLLHESQFEFRFLTNQQWARPRGIYGKLRWEF